MQWLRSVLVKLLSSVVWAYRLVLRPWLPPLCRYTPSCSEYALQALQVHGPVRGMWLATTRICRCHPFHAGGYDPVPLLSSPTAAAGSALAVDDDIAVVQDLDHAAVDVEAIGPVDQAQLVAPAQR